MQVQVHRLLSKFEKRKILLIYMGYLFDSTSRFWNKYFVLDILSFIVLICTRIMDCELKWVKTENSELTFTNSFATATNNIDAYLTQPFYSLEPISSGKHTFLFNLDSATPSATLEIGVITSNALDKFFIIKDIGAPIRQCQEVWLLSWGGGQGFIFGNTSKGKLISGYMPNQVVRMILDMRENTLSFVLHEKNELLAQFNEIPIGVIPVACFLGCGYNSKVTLIRCQHE